jgi:predicted chitinase
MKFLAVSCLLVAASSASLSLAAEGCDDAILSTPATLASATTVSTPAPTSTDFTSTPTTVTPSYGSSSSSETSYSSSSVGSSDVAFTRFFNESMFLSVFPVAISLYNFQGMVDAVATQYPSFANWGDDDADKLELAAFLAQTAHESDNFKAEQEYAWASYNESQYCDTSTGIPCVAGQRYHGRGPIMLSWNYNYYNAGQALGIDLLSQPSLVANNSAIAWSTGLWYWMTPQTDGLLIHDLVIETDGFANSTDIINGALECGGPNTANEQQRIEYFAKMCDLLGVEPRGEVSCNA